VVARAGFSQGETAQSCGFRYPKELLWSSFPKDVEKARTALKLPPVKMGEMKSIPDVKLPSSLWGTGR